MVNRSKLNLSYTAENKLLRAKLNMPSIKINISLETQLELPTKLSIDEIISRLNVNESENNQYVHLIWLVFQKKFKKKLAAFVKKQTQLYYDSLSNKALIKLASETISDEEASKHPFELNEKCVKIYWYRFTSRMHRNNQALKLNECNIKESMTSNSLHFQNENEFVDSILAKMYHTLIHSELMLKILEKELSYALEYRDLLNESAKTIRFIRDNHEATISEKLKPENKYSDIYITQMLSGYMDSFELEKTKWHARIEALKSSQQLRFRKFVRYLYKKKEENGIAKLNADDLLNSIGETDEINDANDEYIFDFKLQSNILSMGGSGNAASTVSNLRDICPSPSSSYGKISESFTIQLGAQLKTTHNICLVRCDILDYCKDRFNFSNELASMPLESRIEPQTIQTAMSLFSDKLCALVLLVENLVGSQSPSSPARSLYSKSDSSKATIVEEANLPAGACSTTESRFINICNMNGCEFHFASIEQQMEKATSLAASTIDANKSKSNGSRLKMGDFFLTKHSNLSQVHAIFHLVCSESNDQNKNQVLKQSDLSSRHPVILGLRNILKACIYHNVSTLTFPLLLTHEMTEVRFFL
jgi:hypothetical protein